MRKLIEKLAARLGRGRTRSQPVTVQIEFENWTFKPQFDPVERPNCRSVMVQAEAKPEPPKKPNRHPGARLTDPSRIPPDARTARWEAKHLFSPYGRLPTRHANHVDVPEPPLSMVCPECEARRQPMAGGGSVAKCEYCGVTIVVWGSLIHWWFVEEVEVEPWSPKVGGTDGRV